MEERVMAKIPPVHRSVKGRCSVCEHTWPCPTYTAMVESVEEVLPDWRTLVKESLSTLRRR